MGQISGSPIFVEVYLEPDLDNATLKILTLLSYFCFNLWQNFRNKIQITRSDGTMLK